MTILKWDASDQERILQNIEEEFSKNIPVILPTDTLYGIAAPVQNVQCLERVFELKQRPVGMTLPIAVGNLPMVDDLAVIHRWQKDTIRRNLPGPFTFVLEVKADLSALVVREGTIAVRVPRHPLFIPLTSRVGPLGLTSANKHKSSDIMSALEADEQFEGKLLVIEDDSAVTGKPSTIIDLRDETAIVLREGKLNIDEFMGVDHG